MISEGIFIWGILIPLILLAWVSVGMAIYLICTYIRDCVEESSRKKNPKKDSVVNVGEIDH